MKRLLFAMLFFLLTAGVVLAEGDKNNGSTGSGTTSTGTSSQGTGAQPRTGR
ncbi:MAG: hypothetical protein JZU65_20105 [Chlorobium sp.]|nr:hypothetical protein [Chlorobium sp.]